MILQGNNIDNIQKQYELAKLELNKIELKINPEKCELISNNNEDFIKDKDEDGNELRIKSVPQAKYLGQIIKEDGSPVNSSNTINFNHLNTVFDRVVRRTLSSVTPKKFKKFHYDGR